MSSLSMSASASSHNETPPSIVKQVTTTPAPANNRGGATGSGSTTTGSTAMTTVGAVVRPPPLSSQKYKSFHYSRVASVAEEDYYFDDGNSMTAPSSRGGSFNYAVEETDADDNDSLDTMMTTMRRSPQQEIGPTTTAHSHFRMIDANSTGGGAGNSESSLNKMSTLSVHQAGNERTSLTAAAGPKRLQRLVLSPPSLHMSFDVDNAPWSQHPQALFPEKPISKSSDNVMHRLHPGGRNPEDMQPSLSASASSTGPLPPQGFGRSSATGGGGPGGANKHHGGGGGCQSFEIAQISAGYMRTSGALGQFRGVLSAPMEKGSILRMNFMKSKQQQGGSKERDRPKKDSSASTTGTGGGGKNNSFSTTTLTALFGHNTHNLKDNALDAPPTCPTSVDETGDALPYAPGLMKNMSLDETALLQLPKHSLSGSGAGGICGSQEKKPPDEEECSASSDEDKSKSCRMEFHRKLFTQRGKACDYSFGFAILGIVLMIIETELSATGVYTKESIYSYGLKSLIVLSTLILLVLIVTYHATDIRLFMLDHGCDDWRIAIRRRRICMITIELLICMICPVPGSFYFTYRPSAVGHSGPSPGSWQGNGGAPPSDSVTSSSEPSPSHPSVGRIPVDIILSIPMFLRFYLICRLMLLHSKLFTDGPSRSISALNRVNITARLVLKMMMTVSPVTVLLAFTGSFWLTAAWIMLVCERYGAPSYMQSQNGGFEYEMKRHQSVVDYESARHESYLNSIWLVAVTSLTIGYGDVVPSTYCGRTVSIICGIVGAGTSSLVVAVVARKLEFSRAEKHVHNFMMDSMLTKRMKNAAANVLRETWLIYKNRKLVEKVDASKIRLHQRKFLLAIYELRKTKRGRRKLDENFITVADMAKTTSMMYEIVSDMRTRQQEMEQKILDTEKRCVNVEAYIGQLQVSICALPELVARKLRPPSPHKNQ